jgi:Domain of unknown function (DUF397)
LADLMGSPTWRRSRRCDTGNCVEAAFLGGHVEVRDSKDPDGPVLRLSVDEWANFVAGVKAGAFQFTNIR